MFNAEDAELRRDLLPIFFIATFLRALCVLVR